MMGYNGFEGHKLPVAVFAVVAAAVLCCVGILCVKVDIFTKLDPNHPMAKRVKHFHKKFGIFFIVFSLVWLAAFLVMVYCS